MSKNIKSNVEYAEQKTSKNSIYFIGGEKGGVGKSFFSRCLVDYFVTKGWKEQFVLIEGDSTINDVGSIFEDNQEQVKFSDDRYRAEVPNVIVDEIEYRSSVVNLPANVMEAFDSWMERTGVFLLKDRYVESMLYFFVSDGCWRSIELFMKQIKKYDMEKFPHCLVFNLGRLTSGENFHYLEQTCPELIEVLRTKQIPVIFLPLIPVHLQFICDRTNLPYAKLGLSREEMRKKFEADYPDNLGQVMSKKLTSIGNSGAIATFIKKYTQVLDEIFNQDNIKNPEGLQEIAKKQAESLKNGNLPDHSG